MTEQSMSRRLGKHTDAARVLNVQPATIRKWTLTGRIPCIRLSPHCVRYDLEQIIEHFKNKE